MTTVAQLRKAALALPETEEGTHFGMVAFMVRGKGFVNVTNDGIVQLQMSDEDAERALGEHASGERLVRMGTPIGFRIPLADINGKDLNALVRLAWMHRAPKRLAQSLRQADAGDLPAGSDLPSGIGKPATRALLGAGIATLADVARRSDEQLLSLHGVGPKALAVLQAAVGKRGRDLRQE